jgi:FtsH-binding integral membrane protein
MNDFNTAYGSREMDTSVNVGLRSFMLGVYNKMALGLLLTAALAFIVGSSPALTQTLLTPPLVYLVMFGPIGILLMSSFVMKNPSPLAANAVYWSVVALIGVGMGAIVYTYARIDGGMIMVAKAFLTTSAAFGALSLWGYTTKRDLSGWGVFLFMGVIGLIIASVINMFVQSSMFSFIISVGGVLIFAGLTAYDTQRLKEMYFQIGGNVRAMSVATTYGALSLYLNFINMFQFILALMSSRD